MNNILVIRPGALGDALLAFPVLKLLRKQYSDSTRISLVSNAQVLPLAQAFDIAEETYDFQDIQWSELFSSSGIRTPSMRNLLSQADLVICWMRDPGGLIEHNLKTSGVKHRIIASGRPSPGETLHIVDYLAQTVGLAPTTSDYSQQIIGKTPEMTTKRFIAIHPGSGAATKCWPTFHYAGAIKRLWKQNFPVLLLSGPADTERVDDLLQQLPFSHASGMLKVLACAPLLEVAQQLQQCRCYLGNDSGITHLAAMVGVPTVAIFGPTDPKIWRPLGPFVNVIQGQTLEDVTVADALECLDL